MANKEFPLSLLIKAVDQATEPLRRINKQIKDFTAPIRKLNNSFRALAAEAGIPRVAQSFRAVGTAVGRVGHEAFALGKRIALMAVGAVYALHRLVTSTMQAGDDLATLSNRVGMTADAFAQLRFAAEQSDVEAEQFAKGMDYFNKTLGEAKAGTGALTTLLKKSTPALLQQLKGAKDAEEGIALMTRAFVRIQDPTKRAALAAAAFGRSGQQIGVWLSKGTDKIDEQRRKYFELMGSQNDFADQSSKLDNTLRETEMSFSGLRFAIAAGLFPAFRELSEHLTKFIVKHREGIAKWAKETGEAIMDWVKKGGLKELKKDLKAIADSVRRFVDAIGGIKGIAVIAGAILGGKLLLSVLSLGLALKGLVVAVGSVVAVLGVAAAPVLIAAVAIGFAAYQVVKHWKPLKQFFVDLWDEIVRIFEHASGKVGAITDKMSSVADTIRGVIDPFGEEQSGKILGKRPVLGAATIIGAGQPAKQGEAHITVDFNNLPRGARVNSDSANTAPVDLSLGYSMVNP
jgi:hypothetical protein